MAFGLLRAYTVRSDLRYVWVAIASYAGVGAAMAMGRVSGALVMRFIVAFVIATLFGWSVAMFTGAKPVPAFMVALFFGFCSAGGATLFRLSHSGDK
jgi:FtsH-binding integral membrane protein